MVRFLLSLAFVVFAQSTAEATPRWSSYVGAEGAGQKGAVGHGLYTLKYVGKKQPNGRQFSAELHTDTVRLEWSGLEIGPETTAGLRLTGEALYANLVPDYFLEGTRRMDRGFFSSYTQGQVWLKARLSEHLWGTAELGGRRWFAQRTKSTDPAFVLPAESWQLEPRLHLTWWGLAHDAAWSDGHRLFPRSTGFATGVSVGLDWADQVHPWGAMEPTVFTPADSRNHPESVQWLVYQWLRAGLPLGRVLRLELEQSSGYRSGADDRGRWPAGGLNPYVAPLAGAFWAYFHTASFLAASGTLRHTLGGLEWGAFVTGLDVEDPQRIGADVRRTFWGTGLLVDWRSGVWQLDLRGGYSPSLADFAPAARPWSIFAGVGWAR